MNASVDQIGKYAKGCRIFNAKFFNNFKFQIFEPFISATLIHLLQPVKMFRRRSKDIFGRTSTFKYIIRIYLSFFIFPHSVRLLEHDSYFCFSYRLLLLFVYIHMRCLDVGCCDQTRLLNVNQCTVHTNTVKVICRRLLPFAIRYSDQMHILRLASVSHTG